MPMDYLKAFGAIKGRIVHTLEIDRLPAGAVSRLWLQVTTDGMGQAVHLPVLVAKGAHQGPVLGLTAAIHGNEINGISVIQHFFRDIQVDRLSGVVVGVPVVNVPAVLLRQRRFFDETDLNTIMPGREDGNAAQVYAFRITDRIIRHFDYLIDLHTAGSGRENAFFVRANLEDPVTRQMAFLQNAPVVIHNPASDGSLRGVADTLGIQAITVELGKPQMFEKSIVRSALAGIYNLMYSLEMIEGTLEPPAHEPLICKTSYWFFSDSGGILSVWPQIGDFLYRDQPVASLRNIFGDLIKTYTAPEDGVMIGKSVDPINQTGGRILHLGILDPTWRYGEDN
jgi:predicted deacylase